MKFIDEAEIFVEAGKGGAGSRHFRREKFVPLGGPDGGNGGAGGSVILEANRNVHTLLDFRHRPRWKADDGEAGDGSLKDGKKGKDLIIRVPIGTEALDSESGDLICDLSKDESQFIICHGGRGGKGNAHFKSPTNRTPEHAQPGEAGQERNIKLSLKLVADVGIIGLPNAGKSTLISRLSAARPKIADYPFTTLIPNLGVVRGRNGLNFVIADIPGLIKGAHQGKGLGIRFLKHIERTRVLVHLIDLQLSNSKGEKRPAIDGYDEVHAELNAFSEDLIGKPEVIVLSKADTLLEPHLIEQEISPFKERGLEVHVVSSVSGKGLSELVDKIVLLLQS